MNNVFNQHYVSTVVQEKNKLQTERIMDATSFKPRQI